MSQTSLFFETRSEPPGFDILDPIEGRRVAFRTERVPEFAVSPTADFSFPVDQAVSIETRALHLDRNDHVSVWSPDRSDTVPISIDAPQTFEESGHLIEISAPIKLYLDVDGPFSVDVGLDYVDIDMRGGTTVAIGARSYHERPGGTITIGPDPEDAMTAISAFGGARKSTTPDVSFPTLRGHPPRIELGDELDVPEGLTPPESGITIEVPRTRRMIYPTASLAYYLGASVEPGSPPRLVTNDGFVYNFDDDHWLEDAIARVLRHVLLLDGVVRSVGPFGQDVYERQTVEPLLGTDLETLYELPLRDRLAEYLAVPFADVEHLGPRWVMTAFVPPTPDGAKYLPHVVNELGIVRTPRGTRVDDREARSSLGLPAERSRMYVSEGEEERYLVRPALFDDSVEHIWFGRQVPVGATKGTLEAFESALDHQVSTAPLDVALVATDEAFGEEQSLEESYSVRDDLAYTVSTVTGADTERLQAVLAGDFDVLHFVGETVPAGFVTSNGVLPLADIETVDVGVFFLQADHSFEEAQWLAKHGALGGIGTVGTVTREQALTFGKLLGRLLNMGFPLRGAVDIASQEVSGGDQYVIVGNGSVNVAQSESAMPNILTVEQTDDSPQFYYNSYPSGIFRVGSIVSPSPSNGIPYIGPGEGDQVIPVSPEEGRTIINRSTSPARIQGKIYWTSADILGSLSRLSDQQTRTDK